MNLGRNQGKEDEADKVLWAVNSLFTMKLLQLENLSNQYLSNRLKHLTLDQNEEDQDVQVSRWKEVKRW